MADDRVHSVYGTREEEIDRANRWQARAEKAEARVRELEAFVYRCAEGDHPDEIPEEAREMLAAEQEEGT